MVGIELFDPQEQQNQQLVRRFDSCGDDLTAAQNYHDEAYFQARH